MNELLIENYNKEEKIEYLKVHDRTGFYLFVELLYGTIEDGGKVNYGSEKYYDILSKVAKDLNNYLSEEYIKTKLNLLKAFCLIKIEENVIRINNYAGYIDF